MSVSQISAFRLHQGGPNSRVAVDSFPYSGQVLTHSANAIVTDSASSGTAFSTGEKTNNRALGVDIKGQSVENITETLDKSGYVSSVISTSEVTHATPAAFVVHASSRYLTDEISIQMTDSKIKNILGGGRKFFIAEEDGGNREDGINLIEKVKSKSILITDKSELSNPAGYDDSQVFGLFADEHLRDDSAPENHSTEPSIENMLEFSVNRSKNFIENGCKGFFIMAEASQVDWAGHGNDFEYLMREMSDLEDGIKWALKFAKKNKDTLVVVTADHETGGLLIEPNDPRKYENPDVKFSLNTGIGRGSHTGVPVPIYAYGPGAENFTGTLDNTDVHKALLAAANQDKSGSCIN
jgi:alkaline phosphatase